MTNKRSETSAMGFESSENLKFKFRSFEILRFIKIFLDYFFFLLLEFNGFRSRSNSLKMIPVYY